MSSPQQGRFIFGRLTGRKALEDVDNLSRCRHCTTLGDLMANFEGTTNFRTLPNQRFWNNAETSRQRGHGVISKMINCSVNSIPAAASVFFYGCREIYYDKKFETERTCIYCEALFQSSRSQFFYEHLTFRKKKNLRQVFADFSFSEKQNKILDRTLNQGDTKNQVSAF